MINRIPQSPPEIQPLTPAENRPLFSIMIPAFNCAEYLSTTIESVLQQDIGEKKMQIEVVDDCSTDGDIAALVEKAGNGRVNYYRQKENVGSLRNFETCIKRAAGYYVHLLHGDDFVKKGFYKEIEFLFNSFPEIGSAITNYNWIDENFVESHPGIHILKEPGIIDNWLYKIASRQLIQPPAVVVKRNVYEQLGSFFGVKYGEDWEMWIRIASKFKVGYSPKCLATYRGGHKTNISSNSISTGEYIKDILKVIDIAQNYLPKEKRRQIRYLAKKNFSISYAKSSYKLFKRDKNGIVAFKLANGSLILNKNIRSLYWIACLYIEFFKSFFIKSVKRLYRALRKT